MTTPLEVVHIDAHADLGLGDASYSYLMGELAYEPIEKRYEILKAHRPSSRSERRRLPSGRGSAGGTSLVSCTQLGTCTRTQASG